MSSHGQDENAREPAGNNKKEGWKIAEAEVEDTETAREVRPMDRE